MPTKKQLSAKSAGLLQCLDCHKLQRDPEVRPRGKLICPRCGAAVHQRRPDSLAKTWALALTALICLIPANVYPIMTLIYRGEPETSTIIEGVILLVKDQAIPIAVVIFIASIAVPFLKVFGLITLLLSIQLKWSLTSVSARCSIGSSKPSGAGPCWIFFRIPFSWPWCSLDRWQKLSPGRPQHFFAWPWSSPFLPP